MQLVCKTLAMSAQSLKNCASEIKIRLDFQRYQLEFTAHICIPNLHKRPANDVASRMSVYRKAVFNNNLNSVSACFRVCQKVIALHAWRKLMREFVANYDFNALVFRQISQQFLAFFSTKSGIPVYLEQLVHYKSVELSIDSQIAETQNLCTTSYLMDEISVLAPIYRLLQYNCSVYKIPPRFKLSTVEKNYLLEFRNSVFNTKFIKLNLITHQLLFTIENNKMTGKQALIKYAGEVKKCGCNNHYEICCKYFIRLN